MAIKRLFTNNAISLLAHSITATATSLSVMPGHGSLYPSPAANEIFTVTLEDQAASVREIVHVTARSGDTFTILRGQEGTAPRAWSASQGNDTLVDHRITADTLYYLKDTFTAPPPVDLTAIKQAIADLQVALAQLPQFDPSALQLAITDLSNRLTAVENAAPGSDFDPSAILAAIAELQQNLSANNYYVNAGFPEIETFKQALDFLLDSDFYTGLQAAIIEINNRLMAIEQLSNRYQNQDYPNLDTYDKAIDYLLQGHSVSGGQIVDATPVTTRILDGETIITLPSAYKPNTTAIFVGGLRQKRGMDFVESGGSELRLSYALTNAMISSGQNLVVDYVVA